MNQFVPLMLLLLASTHSNPPLRDTAPRTFNGPGYYCGGGFLVRLEPGDRVVFTPPETHVGLISLEIHGQRIDGSSGTPGRAEGRTVARYRGGRVRQAGDEGRPYYLIDEGTSFPLLLSSDAFRGYRRDRWFFDRVNFVRGADREVSCLEGQSPA